MHFMSMHFKSMICYIFAHYVWIRPKIISGNLLIFVYFLKMSSKIMKSNGLHSRIGCFLRNPLLSRESARNAQRLCSAQYGGFDGSDCILDGFHCGIVWVWMVFSAALWVIGRVHCGELRVTSLAPHHRECVLKWQLPLPRARTLPLTLAWLYARFYLFHHLLFIYLCVYLFICLNLEAWIHIGQLEKSA